MSTIHARLKKYRANRNLTIQEVSDLTGIPTSTYKERENGRQIRGEPYAKLAEVFEVPLQELITGNKTHGSQLLGQLDEIIREIENVKTDLIALF